MFGDRQRRQAEHQGPDQQDPEWIRNDAEPMCEGQQNGHKDCNGGEACFARIWRFMHSSGVSHAIRSRRRATRPASHGVRRSGQECHAFRTATDRISKPMRCVWGTLRTGPRRRDPPLGAHSQCREAASGDIRGDQFWAFTESASRYRCRLRSCRRGGTSLKARGAALSPCNDSILAGLPALLHSPRELTQGYHCPSMARRDNRQFNDRLRRSCPHRSGLKGSSLRLAMQTEQRCCCCPSASSRRRCQLHRLPTSCRKIFDGLKCRLDHRRSDSCPTDPPTSGCAPPKVPPTWCMPMLVTPQGRHHVASSNLSGPTLVAPNWAFSADSQRHPSKLDNLPLF